MKILYFHQHFSTPQGAGGTRSYEMSLALIEAGHEVTMICGSYYGGKTGLSSTYENGMREGAVDKIKVIEFELPYSNNDSFLKRTSVFLKFAFRSIRVSLTKDYDLAFATSTPLTAGIPGIFARWIRKKTFIFEVRDLWPELPREMGIIRNPVILWMMRALEWSSYHSAHACIGLSPGIIEGIKKQGVKDHKVTMIPNGSDLKLFNPAIMISKKKWIGDVEKCRFVFTGTHGHCNGLDVLIDVAIELKKRGVQDVQIICIGDGVLKASHIKRTKKEGVGSLIIWIPSMPKKELAQLLPAFDVGLMLLANFPIYYYGTSPNKFFDYISSGIPILNNYPGWLADMINKENLGKAILPEDFSLFADSIIWFRDHVKERLEMGVNARSFAEKQFDRNMLATQFVKKIEAIHSTIGSK